MEEIGYLSIRYNIVSTSATNVCIYSSKEDDKK